MLVTHDREEAFSLADRIALMRDGTVVQEGSPESLYLSPASRWAAEFVGAGNFVPGLVRDGRVDTPLGVFPANGASGARTVEVLIRPELVELQPDPAGAAEVVGREFRGHDVFYRVRLGGLELLSHRPSTEAVPLGSRVRVKLHDRYAAVFPALCKVALTSLRKVSLTQTGALHGWTYRGRRGRAAAAVMLAGCGGGGSDTFTIYSGREEELVAPLIEQFEDGDRHRRRGALRRQRRARGDDRRGGRRIAGGRVLRPGSGLARRRSP